MRELKKLRGKQVEIQGGNVVNDIKSLYPDLFPYTDMEQAYIDFPGEILVSITSSDNIDTDYKDIWPENKFELNSISFSNIKIKSPITQTGYIFTAGI